MTNEYYAQLLIKASNHLDSEPSLPTLLDNTLKRVKEISKGSKPIKNALKNSIVLDHYGNTLTSTGTDDKVEQFTNYGMSNDTLNWPLWLALYNDSWVFRRAIDKPSQDCVRTGITFAGTKDKSKVLTQLKKFRFELIQLLQWGALFGGSVAVILLDNVNNKDLQKAMSLDKLKKSKNIKMYVTDRWYGVGVNDTDLVTDMGSLDFGKPKFYNITFADGKTYLVHHDYVLRYEHRTAPQLIKRGYLQGWGYAEGAHIINELLRDDKMKSSIQSLMNKSLIEVIKMPGMRGVFMGADKENETQLMKRLEMVNWGRTFNSLTFLDKDDEYQQNQYSGLNGLADLLEVNMWLVSAALDMQGVLYGDLKQGFSNDTDALERYDETILNRCDSYYRPPLEKFINILFQKYDINEPVEFTFNSLLSKKYDKERMESLKEFVELLDMILSSGVIDTKKYALLLQSYIQDGNIDISFTEEELAKLDDTFEEEMENIDLEENEKKLKKDNLLKRIFNKR